MLGRVSGLLLLTKQRRSVPPREATLVHGASTATSRRARRRVRFRLRSLRGRLKALCGSVGRRPFGLCDLGTFKALGRRVQRLLVNCPGHKHHALVNAATGEGRHRKTRHPTGGLRGSLVGGDVHQCRLSPMATFAGGVGPGMSISAGTSPPVKADRGRCDPADSETPNYE